ncbi:MAG: class I SAM-dependent methyltransferase [Gammaproteobacteria bacterium]|nr:class I SAM-dependent methyltransferase [Gammaproteobacteria bacterium]
MKFTTPVSELPVPDEDSLRHSQRLAELIRDGIERQGGRITFARYMELALYAPGLGYYSAGLNKFGAAGDFVTAPEISPLFARCVARQCRQVLQALGGGDILEFGAGSGAMAADLLAELEVLNSLPQQYFILEISAELRERQRATLIQRIPHLSGRVIWLDEFPKQKLRGFVFANEVLDAMPVHRFQLDAEGISELYVACKDDKFAWRAGPVSDPALAERIAEICVASPDLKPGYISEINLAAPAWVRTVAAAIESGMLLLIDYGYPRHELYHPERDCGALLCHYRHHAHDDPFLYPGLQDIAAHVDFTALAEAGHEAGLDVAGYTTQANFLIACGLTELASQTHSAEARPRIQLADEIKRLTLPGEMGEVFKVLALTRDFNGPVLGFSLRDFRSRL